MGPDAWLSGNQKAMSDYTSGTLSGIVSDQRQLVRDLR